MREPIYLGTHTSLLSLYTYYVKSLVSYISEVFYYFHFLNVVLSRLFPTEISFDVCNLKNPKCT